MLDEFKTDQECIDALGITLAEFMAEIDKTADIDRKLRCRQSRPDGSKRLMDEFLAQPAKLKKAKNKSEQKFIEVQEFLKIILNPSIKIFSDSLGAKVYLEIGHDNIAILRTLDWVVQKVAKPLDDNGLFLKNKDLSEHVKTWSDKVEKLKIFPSSFSLSQTEITFNRINIALMEGPTPTWDQFILRCGANGEALKAFTWSLFVKEDRSQQYLFIKGDGEDGKGSFTRWLNKIFNDQLVGLSVSDRWPALCVGKRVGVFNDLNNTTIMLSSQFKQITGGDKVSIEQKYEKTFSMTLDTKFILTTNRPVNIINSEAERRRAILVEMNGERAFIENYEEKLEQEGSAFLFKCKDAYERLYDKTKKSIKCDYAFFESEASSYEEQHEALFAKCFLLAPGGSCLGNDFYNRLVQELGHDNNKIGTFKDWLKRTHKIEGRRLSAPGRPMIYKGLVKL